MADEEVNEFSVASSRSPLGRIVRSSLTISKLPNQKAKLQQTAGSRVSSLMQPSCTILIVDDEPMVLDVLASILTASGHTVLTARGGYEAVQALAARNIDLLLTDIRMADLDGVQLAIHAKRMHPNLRVIYLTGCAEADEPAQHGRVIRKPVRPVDLVRTVQIEMAG
jgi:CheY-like chemotaxis protein